MEQLVQPESQKRQGLTLQLEILNSLESGFVASSRALSLFLQRWRGYAIITLRLGTINLPGEIIHATSCSRTLRTTKSLSTLAIPL